jgi:hypothetical protein
MFPSRNNEREVILLEVTKDKNDNSSKKVQDETGNLRWFAFSEKGAKEMP